MASGILHTTTTLCAAAVGTSYYGLDNIPASSAWLLAGLYCTVVQPDLDCIEGDKGYYGMYILSKTKNGIEKLWHWYWQPYARTLAHRSFFSHSPILGTAIRLLYGGWWLLPYLSFWNGTPYFLTAILACDILHFILDWRIWMMLRLFRQ